MIKKIRIAMAKAFRSVNNPIDPEELDRMAADIEKTIQERYPKEQTPTVEGIQDLVELTLIDHNYYQVVKSYILYRAKHSMDRKVIEEFGDYIKDQQILDEIEKFKMILTIQDIPSSSFIINLLLLLKKI